MPTKDKYVTETLFRKESKTVHKEFEAVHKEFEGVHKKFEAVHQEFEGVHKKFEVVDKKFESVDKEIKILHQKVDNVALAVVNNTQRLERVENTMATKSDIGLILNRFDHLFKKVSLFDQEERVQGLHLLEVKKKVDEHEQRLAVLESSR